MPLDKVSLQNSIIKVLRAQHQEGDAEYDPNGQVEESITNLAKGLADAIDMFVKSGTVNTTVITSGSPGSHTGTGTGSIT